MSKLPVTTHLRVPNRRRLGGETARLANNEGRLWREIEGSHDSLSFDLVHGRVLPFSSTIQCIILCFTISESCHYRFVTTHTATGSYFPLIFVA